MFKQRPCATERKIVSMGKTKITVVRLKILDLILYKAILPSLCLVSVVQFAPV